MSQIFGIFGIDWRLLIINAVNFALVIGVLWYFLYVPIMRMLEARRQKVVQGVEDAQAAAQERAQIEASRGGVLAAAGVEADALMVAARAAAVARERELIRAGEAAATVALNDAKLEALELKERALQESRQELAKLIVLGVEKTLRQSSGQALAKK